MLPIEYVQFRRDLPVRTMSLEVLRVLFVLSNRQKEDTRLGLTLTELARSANIGVDAAKDALEWLAGGDYIRYQGKRKKFTIVLVEHWFGESKPIPFTYDDTDHTRLVKAQEEIARLNRMHQAERSKAASGLAEVLTGEERDLVIEIEKTRGFGLDVREAYILGKSVASFNPERVKQTWRRMQKSLDPIRAAYAALWRGIKGPNAQALDSKPFTKVTYRSLEEEA